MKLRGSIVFFLMFFILGVVEAQQRPWESYSRHIREQNSVESLHDNIFGEEIDFYNGRVSFRHVDINIEGNSRLPVSLVRKISIKDPVAAAEYASVDPHADDQPFADWAIVIPSVSGVFAKRINGAMLGPSGIVFNPGLEFSWSNQRCSGLRVPPIVGEFFPADYWYGLQADMPGGGELLAPASGVPSPSAGNGYRWVTRELTWFSCLASVKNGSGEGFLAIGADGTKYWFDWMSEFYEPTLRKSFHYSISTPTGGFEDVYEQSLERRRGALYASRVEDRFGNWVSYTYSNSASQPIRPTKIESNDGRVITILYNSDGNLVSATANGRVWNYTYSPAGDSLAKVQLPDGSAWGIDLTKVIERISIINGSPASCNFPGVVVNGSQLASVGRVVTIRHPSGALGEFEVKPLLHGRTNVPKQCLADPLSDGPEVGADYSDYARFYWANSLVRRSVSGPGINAAQWIYAYSGSQDAGQAASFYSRPSSYNPPGSWAERPYVTTRLPDEGKPVTDISTYMLIEPKCVADSCAGFISTSVNGPDGFARYTYGNSYRYNESKLIRIETGASQSSILRSEQLVYEYPKSGLPYAPIIGATRQYRGGGLADATFRPLKRRVINQGGVTFTSAVNAFDAYARPTGITESSAPTP